MDVNRFKHLDDTTATGQVFHKKNQKHKFYALMADVIKNADPEIDFGAPREEISTHSIRKAADTIAVKKRNLE